MSTRSGGTRPGTGGSGRATSAMSTGGPANPSSAHMAPTPGSPEAHEQRAHEYLRQANEVRQQAQANAVTAADRWQLQTEAHNARVGVMRARDRVAQMEMELQRLQRNRPSLRDYQEAERQFPQLYGGRAREMYQAEVDGRRARMAELRQQIPSQRALVDQLEQRAQHAQQRADATQAAERRAHSLEVRAAILQARADAQRGGRGAVILYDDAAARRTAERVMGRHFSRDSLAAMVGARRGDKVTINARDARSFHISADSKTRSAEQLVSKTRDGIVISQSVVRNERGNRTGASGRELLRTFQELKQAGVTKLEATAARGYNWNGYYTWAKLGFTGPIPPHVLPSAQRQFGNVSNVEQIMAKPGGAQWWKRNGDSWHATFDFRTGSLSQQVLSEYLRQLEKRRQPS